MSKLVTFLEVITYYFSDLYCPIWSSNIELLHPCLGHGDKLEIFDDSPCHTSIPNLFLLSLAPEF